MNNEKFLWALVDSCNIIIHHTYDPTNLEFMIKQVEAAGAAGDSWMVVEYKLSRVIDGQSIKLVSQGGV